MAANATTLTEKMRAALRISSTSEKITEEINDCIAACKADLANDGVNRIDEKDGLIIRAVTLYCKAEFGYNNNAEKFRNSYDTLKMRLSMSQEYNTPIVSETDTVGGESGDKMAEWVDELTLVKLTEPDKRVNSNGFAEQGEESRRTVFCNMKSVGYNEYFKSQQTGKVVERKCDVHKADYEGEDTVELGGKAYFVLKTYDIDDDTVELTLTDLRYKEKGA